MLLNPKPNSMCNNMSGFNHIPPAARTGRPKKMGVKVGAMLALLLFFACKREAIDPPEGFDQPVFYADYRLGNGKDTIHLVAGIDRIYHFTDFTPTDLIVCTGAFAPADCPKADCPGSLKFEFQNNAPGNTLDPALFEPGERRYAGAAVPEGRVAIQWIDPNGQIWRSNTGIQQGFAYFHLVKSDPYFNNEKGQKTQKMEIAFSCGLFKENGQEIRFDGTGVVAVAYP